MEIVITAWALDSYLELKHQGAFSDSDYKNVIRPDVLRLKNYANDPKFGPISDGFKMKWHNLGANRVQLRLPVGKFKTHLELIRRGRYTECGRLV